MRQHLDDEYDALRRRASATRRRCGALAGDVDELGVARDQPRGRGDRRRALRAAGAPQDAGFTASSC